MKKLLIMAMGLLMSVAAYAGTIPQYPGGKEAMDEFIASNMKYPAAAIENGIEGTVDIAFTVKADGSIGAIKIMRMVDPDLESEAIRLVKIMPNWIPADKNGTPVDAHTQIPIIFILP